MDQRSATAPTRDDARVRVLHVGVEREPVVVIDDATGAAAELVEIAARQSAFSPAGDVGSGYPGLLGTAPTSYVDRMVRYVLPLIEEHFVGRPVAPARARGNFSLVTTPPEDLSPEQRIPHVDAADRLQFATVHFLSAGTTNGTGFFRHRATGFETIDPVRLPVYQAALATERDDIPTGYTIDSGPQFELLAGVAAKPDRLMLYRAALLHSGLIAGIPDHARDPRRGRLTGNLFLQCRLA